MSLKGSISERIRASSGGQRARIVATLLRFIQSATRRVEIARSNQLRVKVLLIVTKAPATVRGRYSCSLNWLRTCFTLRSFGPAELRRDPQDDIALCRHDVILPRWGGRSGAAPLQKSAQFSRSRMKSGRASNAR